MPPRAAVLGGGGAVTERNSDDFRNHCARLRQCMNYLDLEILSHTLSVTSTRALLPDVLVYLLCDGEGAHMESAIWLCKPAPDTRQV
jgi:hypothetical protein